MKKTIALKNIFCLAAIFSLSFPSWGQEKKSIFDDFVKKGSAAFIGGGSTEDAVKKVAFGLLVSNALKPREFKEEPITEDAVSITTGLTMKFEVLGRVRAVKRVSKITNPKRKMPALFLLTSAGTGIEAVQMMEPPANTMVVALDYEVPAETTGVRERALYMVTQIPKIQGAIVAMLFWLAKHADNVDTKRISTINIGLGTFLAPLSLRVAEALSFSPAGTVFIHGGVQVKNFLIRYFEENPRVKPGAAVLDQVYKILDFIDPRQHLQHLNSPFYVIQPQNDKLIPKASSEALKVGLPNPKKIREADMAEVMLERDAAFAHAIGATKQWLLENDAIRE